MARYRMYFVDRFAQSRWPYDIYVGSDGDALEMAHALQYACADVPVGIELWQGARRIPGTSNRNPGGLRADWDEVCARKPGALLQITEALHNSGTSVAKSRRLMGLKNEIEHRQNGSSADSRMRA
jgi:hypothetical protein